MFLLGHTLTLCKKSSLTETVFSEKVVRPRKITILCLFLFYSEDVEHQVPHQSARKFTKFLNFYSMPCNSYNLRAKNEFLILIFIYCESKNELFRTISNLKNDV
jgi:hypothetical protein